MAYDTDVETALKQPVAGFFMALDIDHPLGNIRMVDGGVLGFNSTIYQSRVSGFGSIGGLDIGESNDGQAPTLSVIVLPESLDIVPTFCQPDAQGAAVRLWTGAYNPATGRAIGQAELRFSGKIDVPTADWAGTDNGKTSITYDCISGWELLFATNDGARLSTSFQQSMFAADEGFSYMTMVTDQMPWGMPGTPPAITVVG